jgi:hypothetical protein
MKYFHSFCFHFDKSLLMISLQLQARKIIYLRLKHSFPLPLVESEDQWTDDRKVAVTNLFVFYAALSAQNDKDRGELFSSLWPLLLSDVEWVRNVVYLSCGASHPSAFPHSIHSLLTWADELNSKKKSKIVPFILRTLRCVTQEKMYSSRLEGPTSDVIMNQYRMLHALTHFWQGIRTQLSSLPRTENTPAIVNYSLVISNFTRALVYPSVYPMKGPLRVCLTDHAPRLHGEVVSFHTERSK